MKNDIKRPFHSLSEKTNDLLVSLIIALILTLGSYILGAVLGWTTWAHINPIEVFAVFTSYSCTYLCVVQRRINYPIGALSTAAYTILFFQTGLLASAALNLYLTPTLIYGWIRWRKDEVARPVEHLKLKWVPVYVLIAGAAYVGGTLLVDALGGHLALFDVFILVGTVVAQLLMDNKKLENWIVWFLVDAVAIFVYFQSGLALAGFQYIFFFLNAVWGFYEWRKSMKAKTLLGVVSPAQTVEPEPYHDEDWNFPKVKTITGGERLAVNNESKAAKDFDFKQGGTLYVTTGHVPKISEDRSFWRRIGTSALGTSKAAGPFAEGDEIRDNETGEIFRAGKPGSKPVKITAQESLYFKKYAEDAHE